MPNQETRVQNLLNSNLFHDLDPQVVAQLIAAGRWRRVAAGHFVYRQGASYGRFAMVGEGEVELTIDVEAGGFLVVGHIGPGGHFGETSLLTGSCNCLNAMAVTELSLLEFDGSTFDSVLLANPAVACRLSIALARRLRLSFHDHATSLRRLHQGSGPEHNLDPSYFGENHGQFWSGTEILAGEREARMPESTLLRQLAQTVNLLTGRLEPVLLSGEAGTGRRMLAQLIHRASPVHEGPYLELDLRTIAPAHLAGELFGYGRESAGFSRLDQLGVFERMQGGTVVLYNADQMAAELQLRLAAAIGQGTFGQAAGPGGTALHCRLILICTDGPYRQDGHTRLEPALLAKVADRHFRVSPLRDHRRDIPRLVRFYLGRYNRRYGKAIDRVDDRALGAFINYDWPGNLTEMASVVQRAVILGNDHEPLSDGMLLGMPRPEGKWEFDLLRLAPVRRLVTGRFFPGLVRALVGVFLLLVLAVLYFGPAAADKNLGLTLSWVIGWPLLIFGFFFLSRIWCSICGLSVPGWLAQFLVRPQRPTPRAIRQYSGWIMTALCILLFWIEITWNAYQSPLLTALIISAITLGSLLFSVRYQRRVWCRYLCPLGALNAVFSMPSILELRANSRMCLNRCTDHLCYHGDDSTAGCPMFRHPFLVDNNRDCILCGQCVKNCKVNSIHLNLRLAPQELWNQQSPRLADSLLVVSLAAIYYPLVVRQHHPELVAGWAAALARLGLPDSEPLAISLFFFGTILLYLGGYGLLSLLVARTTGNGWRITASLLGYGMIPLVLGAFMATHLEVLVDGGPRLFEQLPVVFGLAGIGPSGRLISQDATFLLQLLTVGGGLLASLYATNRIVKRLLPAGRFFRQVALLPAVLLCLSAAVYLYCC